MSGEAGKPFRAVRVCSWILFGFAVAAWAALAVLVCVTLGPFRNVFARMGAALPVLTLCVLKLGEVGLVAIMGAVVAVTAVKEFCLPWPRVRLWMNVGVVLLAIAFWFFYHMALFLPMMAILEAVGSR